VVGRRSLTEAAVLTEFEHDGTEALDRLVAAAGTPQFDHVVSQLRTERASAQALAEAAAHYTEGGFTILDNEERWGWKLGIGCRCATCSATVPTVNPRTSKTQPSPTRNTGRCGSRSTASTSTPMASWSMKAKSIGPRSNRILGPRRPAWVKITR
jgi:hypothetical protein